MNKRICALALILLMAVTMFAGCANYTTVGTVNGVEIPAGIYIMNQITATSEGLDIVTAQVNDENTAARENLVEGEEAPELITAPTDVKELLKFDIEGTDAKEWLNAKTQEYVANYVAVEALFEEKGLEIADTDAAYLDTSIEASWEQNGAIFQENGIGYDSYKAVNYNNLKYSMLFNEMYVEETTDAQVGEYLEANYTKIKYLTFPVIDMATYSFLSEEDRPALEELAQEALAEFKDGKTLEDLVPDYMPKAYEMLGTADAQNFDMTSNFIGEEFFSLNGDNASQLFTQDFIDEFIALEVGEKLEQEAGYGYLVYEKMPAYSSDAELAYYKSSIAQEMHSDSFMADLKTASADYEIALNNSAVKKFDVKNIVMF